MIKSFEELIEAAREIGPKTMAVAVAQDPDVLTAVHNAYKYGIVNPVLVGKKDEIEAVAGKTGINLAGFEIVNVEDKVEACRKAIKMVANGDTADEGLCGYVNNP